MPSKRRILTEQLPRLAAYRLAYEGLVKPPVPINLTYSVTNACNSRCRTCDIWGFYRQDKQKRRQELSLEEIERLFQNLGSAYFFNISGGEPFLRSDLVEIIRLACDSLHPSVIHIPTNALLPDRITTKVEEMLRGMEQWGDGRVRLTIKPSFDGVGAQHDDIRGVPGNFEKLQETLSRLLALKARYPRLGVGIGTVISTFNVDRLPDIIERGRAFGADTYISEIAEERSEMDNFGHGITPSPDQYRVAIQAFQADTFDRLRRAQGLELLTQGIRHLYYDLTLQWLRQRRQVIPCYAGITNAHVSAYGTLWPCAILADSRSLGDLREHDFNFYAVWHSPRADEVRSGIKARQCDCPLANQAYANVLMSPKALLRVSARIIRARLGDPLRRVETLLTRSA